MLLKRSDQDVIEQVRSDPRVREAIDLCYNEFLDEKALLDMLMPLIKRLIQKDPRMVIGSIAKVYREVTGKSPRTWNGVTGKRPFDLFVADLFRQEGLRPPTGNQIKQALKKNKDVSRT